MSYNLSHPLVSGDTLRDIDWVNYGPAYSSSTGRTNKSTLSGWDKLWAMECVAERETCLGMTVGSTYYSKVISAAEVRDIETRIRAIRATRRILEDSSQFTDKVLTNYAAGSSPETYFPGSMMDDYGATPSYISEVRTGARLRVRCWYKIWELLRAMNYYLANAAIGTPGVSSDMTTTVDFNSVTTNNITSTSSGFVYRHAARFYYDEYLIVEDWWERRQTIVRNMSASSIVGFPVHLTSQTPYVYFDNFAKGASSRPDSVLYLVFKVKRSKVDWDSLVTTSVEKFVWVKLTDYSFSYLDVNDVYKVSLYNAYSMLSTVLSLAGVSDDVTHPSQSQADAIKQSVYRNMLTDLLEVSVVDAYPFMHFANTFVNSI